MIMRDDNSPHDVARRACGPEVAARRGSLGRCERRTPVQQFLGEKWSAGRVAARRRSQHDRRATVAPRRSASAQGALKLSTH